MRCRARPFGSKFPSFGAYPSVESEIERLIRESDQLERELLEAQSELTACEQERVRLEQAVTLGRDIYEALSKEGSGSPPGKWGRCSHKGRGTGDTRE